MNKDNILYGIIGLLAGVIIGYLVTTSINGNPQSASPVAANTNAVPAQSTDASSGATLPPDHPPTGGAANSQAGGGDAASTSSAGGVKWNPPSRWKVRAGDGMRLVTYLVPAAGGDSDDAECPVFFFGSGDGGGVQQNIDRWIGQLKQPDGSPSAQAAKQKTETINGFKVTMVDVTGTFSGGQMTAGKGEKSGYRLLGAIVEGPQSPVYFKLIGPAKTVASAQNEFQALLKSLAAAP
ncbi:MAG TPA: hypothetical protein VFD58_26155 [Blastocatellia bacterium]|nr:hypothetical protein [Blastocatellia bacterium]